MFRLFPAMSPDKKVHVFPPVPRPSVFQRVVFSCQHAVDWSSLLKEMVAIELGETVALDVTDPHRIGVTIPLFFITTLLSDGKEFPALSVRTPTALKLLPGVLDTVKMCSAYTNLEHELFYPAWRQMELYVAGIRGSAEAEAWKGVVKMLVHTMDANFRRQMKVRIYSSYSTLPLSLAVSYLGGISVVEVEELGIREGWKVDTNSGMVLVQPFKRVLRKTPMGEWDLYCRIKDVRGLLALHH